MTPNRTSSGKSAKSRVSPATRKSLTAPKVKSKAAIAANLPPAKVFYQGGDDWNVDESIGYLVRKLTNSIQRHVDSKMQIHGLTHSQWGPLMLIVNGKGNTAGALARELDMDAGAMTRMVDRLEDKGMLKRVSSDNDRRVAHLELTRKGRAAIKVVPDSLAEILNHHLRGFGHDEVIYLKASLRRMLENGGDVLPKSNPILTKTV